MGLLDLFMGGSNGIVDPAMAAKAAGSGGLLDFLTPTDADKTAALKRGLLAAGFGMLSAKTGGNALAALGQGGAQGVGAYDDMLQQQKQQKLTGYNMQRQQKQDDWSSEVQSHQRAGWGREDANNAAIDAYKENFGQFKKPDGSFDERAAIAAYGSVDPASALKMQNDYEMKKEAIAARQQQASLANKAQFGGQEILKDEAGNLFFGTTIKDPSTKQIIPSVVAVDGTGIKPTGRLKIANNPYGLTDTEKVNQTGKEKAAEINATAEGAAKADMKGFGTTMSAIARAKELLPTATDSLMGKGRDALLGAVGATTKAAQDAAELETTAGWLMTNVPKFSGPQSDKDTATYNIMAGNVGDRSKPYKERMRSLQALEQFMQAKNQENVNLVGGNTTQAPATNTPQRTFKVLR